MVAEPAEKLTKPTIHYVDGDVRERARFTQLALEAGHHCELYDDLDELSAYPPRDGLIVLRDSWSIKGGVVGALSRLQESGVWLAVIVVGDAQTPSQIVDAIKAGALDYLTFPIEAGRLERCLALTAEEAKRTASLRRRKVEARKMIDALSVREAEVLELLTAGHSNKNIARELGISPRTVEIHRTNMMKKLGATHAASAVRMKFESEQSQFA
jgi:two-component system, LuxR family, response regulator FixJ